MSFYNTWLLPRVLDLVMQQEQLRPLNGSAKQRAPARSTSESGQD
jgi:hypothetical protein